MSTKKHETNEPEDKLGESTVEIDIEELDPSDDSSDATIDDSNTALRSKNDSVPENSIEPKPKRRRARSSRKAQPNSNVASNDNSTYETSLENFDITQHASTSDKPVASASTNSEANEKIALLLEKMSILVDKLHAPKNEEPPAQINRESVNQKPGIRLTMAISALALVLSLMSLILSQSTRLTVLQQVAASSPAASLPMQPTIDRSQELAFKPHREGFSHIKKRNTNSKLLKTDQNRANKD